MGINFIGAVVGVIAGAIGGMFLAPMFGQGAILGLATAGLGLGAAAGGNDNSGRKHIPKK